MRGFTLLTKEEKFLLVEFFNHVRFKYKNSYGTLGEMDLRGKMDEVRLSAMKDRMVSGAVGAYKRAKKDLDPEILNCFNSILEKNKLHEIVVEPEEKTVVIVEDTVTGSVEVNLEVTGSVDVTGSLNDENT